MTSISRFRAAAALVALACLLPCPRVAAQGSATVYRDANGIPHVVADSEEEVWYALGYETGRDGLLQTQINLKRWTGQAFEFLGNAGSEEDMSDPLYRNDVLVRIYGADVNRRYGGTATVQDVAGLLGEPQLAANLAAYAAGLDDYRDRIENEPSLGAQEQELKDWLDAEGLEWVYEDAIDLGHVASYGPWLKMPGFNVAALDDPSPAAVLPEPLMAGARGGPVGDPIDVMKELMDAWPGRGSNCFAWTFELTDSAERHTAHLGAPQSGVVAAPFAYPEGFALSGSLVTRFFAHVVYEPPPESQDEPIDAFGFMDHGSGMFFSFHNRDFALGGSAGSPNVADGFLLRLKTAGASSGDFSGDPIQESGKYLYYSYYRDTDGDEGEDASDWVPLDPLTWSVGGATETTTVLDAGPFGIVANPTPFPAPNTREWVVAGGVQNGIPAGTEHASGPEGTIPCLVAYRAPGLPGVDLKDPSGVSSLSFGRRPRQGQYDRFAAGVYRLLRAESVLDFQDELVALDTTYIVNVCAADREGRVLATRSAFVPRRGDDAGIAGLGDDGGSGLGLTLGANDNVKDVAPEEKYFVYRKFNGLPEPVPARWSTDRPWDWVFDETVSPHALRYLVPDALDENYLAYGLFDPVGGNHHPSSQNPGFATASNDQTYHCYDLSKNPATNEILGNMESTGTVYSTMILDNPKSKNRFFIQEMEEIVGGTAKLTEEESKTLALDNRQFVHSDYPGYEKYADDPDYTESPANAADLPTPVRVVAEIVAELDTRDTGVVDEAHREVKFLADVWAALHGNGPGGEDWTSVQGFNLRNAWVNNSLTLGAERWVPFWPDPQDDPVFLVMPVGFGLIDFLWSEIRLGTEKVSAVEAELDDVVDGAEALVADLEAWGAATDFRNDADSVPALLLEELRLGLRASSTGYDCSAEELVSDAGFEEGRIFLPLFHGFRATHALGRYPTCMDNSELLGSLSTVDKPGANVCLGAYDLDTGHFLDDTSQDPDQAVVFTLPYGPLEGWVFSKNHLATVMSEEDGPLSNVPVPPYDAAYDGGDLKDAGDLTPADLNAITLFFLELGGFEEIYPDPEFAPLVWRTPKADLFAAWSSAQGTTPLPYRPTYPLTRNLARLLLVRRLIEAQEFIEQELPGGALSTFGDVVRTRVYSLDGELEFPATPDGVPCAGDGLHAVGRGPDLSGDYDVQEVKEAEARGFQRRLWALGGDSRPVITIFPDDPQADPRSFFWNLPGQRTVAFDTASVASPHLADHAEAYADNEPLPTYFSQSDYTDPSNHSNDPGLPGGVYTIPVP